MNEIKEIFGRTDIYLIDQILKGNFDDCQTILDVGCGSGRNLSYFLQNDFDVYGIDPNEKAIEITKALSASLNPSNNLSNFKTESIEKCSIHNIQFDIVICNAVLHFAQDLNHFEAMLFNMWKLVKPKGFFFCRLASNIGIENLVKETTAGRYILPDKSERFLVNEEMLLKYTKEMNGKLIEPIKTSNVQNLRCMTTWCLRKQ